MTTTEAAKRLGVSRKRVWDFITNKQIAAVKEGRDWKITEEEVKRFAAIDRVPHRKAREKMIHRAAETFGDNLIGEVRTIKNVTPEKPGEGK